MASDVNKPVHVLQVEASSTTLQGKFVNICFKGSVYADGEVRWRLREVLLHVRAHTENSTPLQPNKFLKLLARESPNIATDVGWTCDMLWRPSTRAATNADQTLNDPDPRLGSEHATYTIGVLSLLHHSSVQRRSIVERAEARAALRAFLSYYVPGESCRDGVFEECLGTCSHRCAQNAVGDMCEHMRGLVRDFGRLEGEPHAVLMQRLDIILRSLNQDISLLPK